MLKNQDLVNLSVNNVSKKKSSRRRRSSNSKKSSSNFPKKNSRASAEREEPVAPGESEELLTWEPDNLKNPSRPVDNSDDKASSLYTTPVKSTTITNSESEAAAGTRSSQAVKLTVKDRGSSVLTKRKKSSKVPLSSILDTGVSTGSLTADSVPNSSQRPDSDPSRNPKESGRVKSSKSNGSIKTKWKPKTVTTTTVKSSTTSLSECNSSTTPSQKGLNLRAAQPVEGKHDNDEEEEEYGEEEEYWEEEEGDPGDWNEEKEGGEEDEEGEGEEEEEDYSNSNSKRRKSKRDYNNSKPSKESRSSYTEKYSVSNRSSGATADSSNSLKRKPRPSNANRASAAEAVSSAGISKLNYDNNDTQDDAANTNLQTQINAIDSVRREFEAKRIAQQTFLWQQPLRSDLARISAKPSIQNNPYAASPHDFMGNLNNNNNNNRGPGMSNYNTRSSPPNQMANQNLQNPQSVANFFQPHRPVKFQRLALFR